MRALLVAVVALAVGSSYACSDSGEDSPAGGHGGHDGDGGSASGGGGSTQDWQWQLPAGFPQPKVPEDNPMSQVKVELGRRLFYDTRLSDNETQSCGSCHEQALAFTDGRARAIGSTQETHPRSSMSLANVGYSSGLTWASSLLLDLEAQAPVPMFGTMPVELGMAGKEDVLLERLNADADYPAQFAAAFPEEPAPVSIASVVRALSCFQRTLISGGSPFDRYSFGGDATAISDAAKRGHQLFNSEKLECFHCHQGFNFQDSVTFEGLAFGSLKFHNTGLYNLGGTGAYPEGGRGLYDQTGNPEDMGKFRVPTLRNIAVTAPYMHDGSADTLDDVLDHYAAAGRTIAAGPNAGVGADNPFKSGFIVGFELSESERADLHAFFESLTDEAFLTDPRFAPP